MDMYQKRKIRQEKKNNQQNNGFDIIQVNFVMEILEKSLVHFYK